jgi:beta-N-acetylhexosaminidase
MSRYVNRELASLAGAVLCVGFPGDAASDEVVAALRELSPGGIVLFARNIVSLEQVRKLVTDLRAALGQEFFVAIDQEGGRVVRFRGAAPLPSAMAVAAAGDAGLAERLAAGIAGELRALVVDVDFAPVADLALVAESTVVGTRAYSDDAATAAEFVAATVSGLRRGGVEATLKHFPGHGASAVDSHLALPVVGADMATLRARELVPFAAGLRAGARAVMLGHILVPALDADRPASLSPKAIELLREEFGFDGAVVTDCLQMDAVANEIGTVSAAVLAMRAGADVLTISHDLSVARAARDAIVAAAERGELDRRRLEAAAVAALALRCERPAVVGHADLPAVAAEIARRAITLVRGDPVLPSYRAVNVISFEGNLGDGVAAEVELGASLHLALRRRRFQAESLRVASNPDDEMIENLVTLIDAQATRSLVILMRRAYLRPQQAKAIERLLDRARDAVLISAAEPFDAAHFSAARNVLCAYGDDEATLEALAEVLAGRLAPSGRLPVRLEHAIS